MEVLGKVGGCQLTFDGENFRLSGDGVELSVPPGPKTQMVHATGPVTGFIERYPHGAQIMAMWDLRDTRGKPLSHTTLYGEYVMGGRSLASSS